MITTCRAAVAQPFNERLSSRLVFQSRLFNLSRKTPDTLLQLKLKVSLSCLLTAKIFLSVWIILWQQQRLAGLFVSLSLAQQVGYTLSS